MLPSNPVGRVSLDGSCRHVWGRAIIASLPPVSSRNVGTGDVGRRAGVSGQHGSDFYPPGLVGWGYRTESVLKTSRPVLNTARWRIRIRSATVGEMGSGAVVYQT